MNTPLLEYRQVDYYYPASEVPALNKLDLAVQPGTVTAILGPNGAGKTTLLHLALGWLKPSAGKVLLDGKPLAGFQRRELGQRMGLVPQTENISFEYSLLEYTLLGRSPYMSPLDMPGPKDIKVALDALEQVGIGNLYERSMMAISGGERQLVLLARALTQQPGLLLLDEPTNHLDLGNKQKLVHLLKELNRQGVTVILTTHEPEIAALLATHMVLMQNGRVLETGTFDEVFQSASLSRLYQIPIEVMEHAGKRIVLWD